MNSITTSMCLSVRGGISMLHAKRRNSKTYMTDNNGKPLSRDDAIQELMNELAKGHEVIPMSKHCGNPCAYSSCKGFDYKEFGCSGHTTGEEPQTGIKAE
jgi:hypothetical protein